MNKFDTKHFMLIGDLILNDGMTAKQITKTAKLKNPSRAIHFLRENGLKIKSVPIRKSRFPDNPVVRYEVVQ